MDNITPAGLVILVTAVIFIFLLPRKYAVFPIIFAACFLTLGQQIKISVFHFTGLRILIFFIIIRLFLRDELKDIKINKIDITFFIWVIASLFINTLLHGTSEAFVNRLGFAYNALGLYCAFRFTIKEMNDIEDLIKFLALIAIPLAFIMILESSTGRNIFSIFGGVPEYTHIRYGRMRCQGPFSHPILAGTFGATLMPFLFSLWFKEKMKLYAFLGFISATTITMLSSSSGPAIAFLGALLALCMWPLRNNMRSVRWLILICVVSLHLFMKAPVWALIGRLSNLIGGTGWHRVALIDKAIAHLGEWWLMGTTRTIHWGLDPLQINPEMVDITNQFISEGVNGGLLKLALFVLIIIFCYSAIGNGMQSANDKYTKIIIWSLGATLFAHIASFLSVAYFDQITTFWFMLLAVIATVGSLYPSKPQHNQRRQSAV